LTLLTWLSAHVTDFVLQVEDYQALAASILALKKAQRECMAESARHLAPTQLEDADVLPAFRSAAAAARTCTIMLRQRPSGALYADVTSAGPLKVSA
jgi:hypothetical protein